MTRNFLRRVSASRSFIPDHPRAAGDRSTLQDRSNIDIVARIEHNDDIRKALYRVREWVIVKRLAAASLARSPPPSLSFFLSRLVSLVLSLSSTLSPSLLEEPPAGNPPPFNSLPPFLALTRPPLLPPTLVRPPRAPHPPPAASTPALSHSTPCAIRALCLVRWWRHLVQFNKRRSIMTSASELPSQLTHSCRLPPRRRIFLVPLSLSFSLFLSGFRSLYSSRSLSL